jgi:hypothetical protein
MNVQEAVKAVEGEVVKVAEEVKSAVTKTVEKVTQELSTDEKLAIREIENSYLKAQLQVQALSQTTQKAQVDFTRVVENLARKYVLDPSVWVFDNVELIWKKK